MADDSTGKGASAHGWVADSRTEGKWDRAPESQRARRNCQPSQNGFPGQHEPWTPHTDQQYPWLHPNFAAATGNLRAGEIKIEDDLSQRRTSVGDDQWDLRSDQSRIWGSFGHFAIFGVTEVHCEYRRGIQSASCARELAVYSRHRRDFASMDPNRSDSAKAGAVQLAQQCDEIY